MDLREAVEKMMTATYRIPFGQTEAGKVIMDFVSENEWIDADAETPATDQRVLCCTKTKRGDLNYVIGYYADERWCCGMNSNVVAWKHINGRNQNEK